MSLRSRIWQRRSACTPLIASAFALPLAAAPPLQYPGDRVGTEVGVYGGTAQVAVVSRGCSGEVIRVDPVRFKEIGAEIRHNPPGPTAVGIRGSVLEPLEEGTAPPLGALLLNPYIESEGDAVGVGVGVLLRRHADGGDEPFDLIPVSAHLRFGERDGPQLALRLFEQPLPYSLGAGEISVGTPRLLDRLGVWVGLSTPVPYDGIGLLVRTRIALSDRLGLVGGGRFGSSAGVSEVAGTAGLTIRFGKRAAVIDVPIDSRRPHGKTGSGATNSLVGVSCPCCPLESGVSWLERVRGQVASP